MVVGNNRLHVNWLFHEPTAQGRSGMGATQCHGAVGRIEHTIGIKHTIVSRSKMTFNSICKKPSWEFCAGDYYNTMIILRRE